MSLIRKHVAVLQAWACLDLVKNKPRETSTKSLRKDYMLLQVATTSESFKQTFDSIAKINSQKSRPSG